MKWSWWQLHDNLIWMLKPMLWVVRNTHNLILVENTRRNIKENITWKLRLPHSLRLISDELKDIAGRQSKDLDQAVHLMKLTSKQTCPVKFTLWNLITSDGENLYWACQSQLFSRILSRPGCAVCRCIAWGSVSGGNQIQSWKITWEGFQQNAVLCDIEGVISSICSFLQYIVRNFLHKQCIHWSDCTITTGVCPVYHLAWQLKQEKDHCTRFFRFFLSITIAGKFGPMITVILCCVWWQLE